MPLHYPDIALHVPTLLMPRADIPLETWAVIACDPVSYTHLTLPTNREV